MQYPMATAERETGLLTAAASGVRSPNGVFVVDFLMDHSLLTWHGRVGDTVLFELNVVRARSRPETLCSSARKEALR